MANLILVVDDDLTYQNLLSFILEKEGFNIVGAKSAAEMHDCISRQQPNLVLLDLGLPDEDGIVLLRQLVARSGPAVIVISGRTDQEMVLTALELGADDYITKPFDPREVLIRINKFFLRTSKLSQPDNDLKRDVIRFNGWILDPRARTLLSCDGHNVPITASEFNLLMALLARPNWALSREQLLDAISSSGDGSSPRTVDVFVSQLRAKLDRKKEGASLILTVRGHGYRFGGTIG